MTELYDKYVQPVTSGGLPHAGALLYFYQAGTTTGITTYQDYASITPHANPVVADASGMFPPVWVGSAAYKTVLKTSAGVTIQTIDNIYGGGGVTSSTDNAIARFDGTTGGLQNSVVTVADTTGILGFPSGGGFNFNGSNVTVTHTADTLTSTGNLTVSKASPTFHLNKTASGQNASIRGRLNSVDRWYINLGDSTTESGTNTGSWFTIVGFDDAGASLGSYLALKRDEDAVFLSKGQLNFPATQNPSSSANTLDDYEEGTWTPGFTANGSATGVTTSIAEGKYTKIGRAVLIADNRIALTSNGTGVGNAQLTGLPFISVGDTALHFIPITGFSGLTAGLGGYANQGTATVALRYPTTTGSTLVTDTEFTNTGNVIFGGSYVTT